MQTTVILSTYNGEMFIEKQLDSIYNQSEKVDEVLICDDRSLDDTARIIKNFIKRKRLSNWKLEINEENLGWRKNYINLMKKANGDIIFICDQDDEWILERVAITKKYFSEHEDALAIVCRSDAIDAFGNHLVVHSMREPSGTEKIKKVDKLGHRAYAGTGCLTAYSRKLNDVIIGTFHTKIKDLEKDSIPAYDVIINQYAFFMHGLYDLDISLIRRRHHENNATSNLGILKRGAGHQSVKERINYIKRNIFLIRCLKGNVYCENKELDEFLKWNEQRINVLNGDMRCYIDLLIKTLKINSIYMLKLICGDFIYSSGINKFLYNLTDKMKVG